MDYFQELLTSYQKIKKRTFRVGYIVEQAQDPMAAYNDAARQAESLVSRGVVPMAQGIKLGANGIITAYTSKTSGGIVPGLAMSDGITPIPGSRNHAVRLATIAGDPEAQQKIGQILLGQQSQEGQPQDSQGSDAQAQQAQADPTGQASMPPEVMAELEYQSTVGKVFESAKKLITGKFFRSAFDSDGNPIKGKRFTWLESVSELQDYFLSNKPQSLMRKLDESITGNDVPLNTEQKQEIIDSALKFLEISDKVNNKTASREELMWVKDHITTGARYSDKRTIRIKSESSDLAVTFKWSGGEGASKDTQFWRHMIDSYDRAVDSWAKNQVPEQQAEELTIPKVSLNQMSPGSGNLESIRGIFAEDFLSIGTILNKALEMESIDPTKAMKYRMEAVKIFEHHWNKCGNSLLEAFGALESFLGEGVAVDDDTLSQFNDLKDLAKVFNLSLTEASLGQMNPEQKKKLAGAFTMKIFKSLATLDSQFAFKLKADYTVTIGTNTRNGKKTDVAFVFRSKKEAEDALKRVGISDADIPKFLMDSRKALDIFGDTEVGDRVTSINSTGGDAYVIPVGLKTYLTEKGIKMGSTSAAAAIDTLTASQTPQAKKIRDSVKAAQPAEYAKHEQNVQEIARITALWDGRKPKGKKVGEYVMKSILDVYKHDPKWPDLDIRIENYKKNPESEPAISGLIDKYIESQKASTIMETIRQGLNSTSSSTRRSWGATLQGLLMATGSAAEQNQITLSRVLETGQSFSLDHNGAIDELVTGLGGTGDEKIKIVLSGQSLQFVKDCGKRAVCDEHHFGSLNMSEGGFTLHIAKNNIRRLDNKFAPSANRTLPEKIQASTDIMINFLLGQKQLLEQLLAKYQ